ncbi:MAG: glycosyltransferase family 39 protein [Chloroflexota bacterium]|nr:glycosyltransferase family 39 protein [Chloroflexota bacterium]
MNNLTQPRKICYLILSLFLCLGTAYSVTIPIFEMFDEISHYPMVQYIATHSRLPVQPLAPRAPVGPWRQEASQPPLYYLISAALTSWLDTSDLPQLRHINPQANAGLATTDEHNRNLALHNPALARFPWQGTALAVHLIRFFSLLLSTWAIYLGWLLLRELFPARPWLTTAATALSAFTPMFIFISASVDNDTLVIPLSILALLLMVRILKQKNSSRFPTELQLGIVIGLAILSKEGALALLPLAGATSLWAGWQQPSTRWRNIFSRLLTWLLPVIVVAGWWYKRNYRLYHDWLGLNAFLNVAGARAFTPTLAELWAERGSFLAAYWGIFGGFNIPLPTWLYTVLNSLVLIAGIGLLWRFARWLHAEKPGWRAFWPTNWNALTAARVLSTLWPAALCVSLLRWTSMTKASQGRLLFPALPLWSVGLLLGLISWWPPKSKITRDLLVTFPSGLLILSLIALPTWILPSYRPPAPLPPETIILHRLDVDFGGHLRLLGYDIPETSVRPGGALELSLYWESLAPTETDHLIFIHLLGQGDRIVAQRDSAPGRGLISTTWLEPGRRWVEHYTIAIPATAYDPDELTLSVGVYDATSGARLPTAAGDSVHFGEATLQPRTAALQVQLGRGILLTDYELSATTITAGQPLTLTLHWLGQAAMERDYTISVQLIDSQWRKAAQSDAWPLDGAAPTSSWERGQQLREERVLNIAPEAIPGIYDLRLAAYYQDAAGAIQHLPISWRAHQTAVDNLTLTRIRVNEEAKKQESE